MKRGEIYYIKSSYSESGFEIKGSRPGVIVSNDKNNERSGCLEVVFLTTQPKKNLPTHVPIRQDTARTSTVLCEQITTVDIGRFADYMGALTDEEMLEVDKALAISLGLNLTETTETKTTVTVEETYTDDEVVEAVDADAYNELFDECRKLETELAVYKKLYAELMDRFTR
jgi:mRNA interferase MazF